MSPSKIEWTDETWNPVTGCSRVSAGCANCYAERMAKRLAGLAAWVNPQCPRCGSDRVRDLREATWRCAGGTTWQHRCADVHAQCGHDYVPSLDWVIAGSESGPRRRETDIAWVRSLRDQCVLAHVPFFLKQIHIDGKKVATPELDGCRWTEVPHDA